MQLCQLVTNLDIRHPLDLNYHQPRYRGSQSVHWGWRVHMEIQLPDPQRSSKIQRIKWAFLDTRKLHSNVLNMSWQLYKIVEEEGDPDELSKTIYVETMHEGYPSRCIKDWGSVEEAWCGGDRSGEERAGVEPSLSEDDNRSIIKLI